MEQHTLLEKLIPINQQLIELLQSMKQQKEPSSGDYLLELELLQFRLDDVIESAVNDPDSFQTQLAKRFLELQEKERREIAHFLYNHFGQTLYSFLLGIDLLEKYDHDPMITDHLHAMREQVYVATMQIKDIANKLYPLPICDLGLVPATRSLIHKLQEKVQYPIQLHISEGSLELLPMTTLFVYRVIESIMGFILQLAHVNHITININFSTVELELQFVIKYSDDLKRFAAEKTLDYYEILHRVNVIGGKMAIIDGYAMTKLEISVPVVHPE